MRSGTISKPKSITAAEGYQNNQIDSHRKNYPKSKLVAYIELVEGRVSSA